MAMQCQQGAVMSRTTDKSNSKNQTVHFLRMTGIELHHGDPVQVLVEANTSRK